MTLAALHQTLEQEVHALTRGASLECLVCGEFVLRSDAEIRCLECGTRLPIPAEPGLQLQLQAG